MEYSKSFLVSCVGAYDDSGIGTGGFVCVNNGEAFIVDKMDSTGLYRKDEDIYRFVRSMQSVIGYNEEGIKYILKLPETRDVHDIVAKNGNIICVSTGTNEVHWYNPFGELIKKWKARGTGDAWHLNCLYLVDDKLFVSAFGEFDNHRGWSGNCAEKGFILEIDSNKKILKELTGPHNPRYIDDNWIVCESHINTLTIRESGGEKKIKLSGFTRGIAVDKNFIYVGESADRKADVVSDHSFITIINRTSYTVINRIRIPFPEIYEILIISDKMAKKISEKKEKFIVDYESDRINALEKQVEQGFIQFEKLKISYSWRNSLTRVIHNLKKIYRIYLSQRSN